MNHLQSRYANKVAVITGAGGGIGRAACVRLASEGASIVAVDLDKTALAETAELVEGAGGAVHSVIADVGDASQVQQYVDEAVATFGGIDLLFNNAGIMGQVAPLEELDEHVFDDLFRINIKSVWLGMRCAKPAMQARGGGVIINTASAAGLTATPTLFGYGASKHAVVGMTKTAAVEMAHLNIRVNCICPGIVETSMIRKIEDQSVSIGVAASADEFKNNYNQRAPLGRYVTPSEVAALLAFLGSDEASMITGESSVIDGGFLHS